MRTNSRDRDHRRSRRDFLRQSACASLGVTSLVNAAPPEARATVVSMRMFGNRVSQIVLPAVAGLLASITGAAGVFAILALALGLGSVAVRRAMRDGAHAAAPDRTAKTVCAERQNAAALVRRFDAQNSHARLVSGSRPSWAAKIPIAADARLRIWPWRGPWHR